MRKIISIVSLLTSILAYISQVIFYTSTHEVLIYSALGVLWFMTLIIVRGGSPWQNLSLSALSAFAIGFVPHRLRMGDQFELYSYLFPLLHFAATICFLSLSKRRRDL
jgi:hypothetical protein